MPSLSPGTESLKSPQGPDGKFFKQKSLPKLLRSTRQSSATSVLHRDGDIILIKGGKIVSVRKMNDGSMDSPTASRAPAVFDNIAETLNESRRIMCGITLDPVPKSENENKNRLGDIEKHSSESYPQAPRGAYVDTLPPNGNVDLPQNGIAFHSTNSHSVSAVGQSDNREQTDNKLFAVPPVISVISSSQENIHPKQLKRSTHQSKSQENIHLNQTASPKETIIARRSPKVSPLSALQSLMVSIPTPSEVLLGMPLSPHTRQHIAKSDADLTKLSSSNGSQAKLSHSHSSNMLSKRPPLGPADTSLPLCEWQAFEV